MSKAKEVESIASKYYRGMMFTRNDFGEEPTKTGKRIAAGVNETPNVNAKSRNLKIVTITSILLCRNMMYRCPLERSGWTLVCAAELEISDLSEIPH
jgi:hypothetical protein